MAVGGWSVVRGERCDKAAPVVGPYRLKHLNTQTLKPFQFCLKTQHSITSSSVCARELRDSIRSFPVCAGEEWNRRPGGHLSDFAIRSVYCRAHSEPPAQERARMGLRAGISRDFPSAGPNFWYHIRVQGEKDSLRPLEQNRFPAQGSGMAQRPQRAASGSPAHGTRRKKA